MALITLQVYNCFVIDLLKFILFSFEAAFVTKYCEKDGFIYLEKLLYYFYLEKMVAVNDH